MCEVKLVKSVEMFPVIKEILKKGINVSITVTGMSMYPFLREKIDRVELTNASFTGIHRGDIVLILRGNGEYILHRIIRKEEYGFYIVGDAQQWIEGPLSPEQLIAVATAVSRRKRYIKCSSLWWKALSAAWLRILPFRYLIIRTYRQLSRIKQIKRIRGTLN